MSDRRWMPIQVHARQLDELRKAEIPIVTFNVPMFHFLAHADQAMANHGQTLDRLAERGGLSAGEAIAILEDKKEHRADLGCAHALLGAMVADLNSRRMLAELRGQIPARPELTD